MLTDGNVPIIGHVATNALAVVAPSEMNRVVGFRDPRHVGQIIERKVFGVGRFSMLHEPTRIVGVSVEIGVAPLAVVRSFAILPYGRG